MHTEFILKWACHASEVSNLYEHQLSLNLYKNWLAFPLQESFAVECTCFANLTFIPEMFEIWIQMSGFWNLNCSKAEKGEPRLRPGFRATTWRTPCPRAATRCAGSSISPARPATASHALDASMYYYICSSQANSNEDEFFLAFLCYSDHWQRQAQVDDCRARRAWPDRRPVRLHWALN